MPKVEHLIDRNISMELSDDIRQFAMENAEFLKFHAERIISHTMEGNPECAVVGIAGALYEAFQAGKKHVDGEKTTMLYPPTSNEDETVTAESPAVTDDLL